MVCLSQTFKTTWPKHQSAKLRWRWRKTAYISALIFLIDQCNQTCQFKCSPLYHEIISKDRNNLFVHNLPKPEHSNDLNIVLIAITSWSDRAWCQNARLWIRSSIKIWALNHLAECHMKTWNAFGHRSNQARIISNDQGNGWLNLTLPFSQQRCISASRTFALIWEPPLPHLFQTLDVGSIA